jgi:alpha-tubulin suppressor-like RCC1 family protein
VISIQLCSLTEIVIVTLGTRQGDPMNDPTKTARLIPIALLATMAGCSTVIEQAGDGEPAHDGIDETREQTPATTSYPTLPVADATEYELVEQLVAGGDHVCARSVSGRVRCWGANDEGQLGYGHTDAIGVSSTVADHPDVPVGMAVAELAAGGAHTCAIVDSGAIRCWGRGADLALGRGSYDPTSIGDDEAPAVSGDSIVDVSAGLNGLALGGTHSCAHLAGSWSTASCWGTSELGALGYGPFYGGVSANGGEAGMVPLGSSILRLVAGVDHTCALTESGSVRCWGRAIGLGGGGLEHIGDDEPACVAPTVSFAEPSIDIAAGDGFTCALSAIGQVRCWGDGEHGVLGHGSEASILDGATAEPIVLGATAVAIAAGSHHACAITDAQTVRCWGSGAFGALGHGSTQDIGDDELVALWGDIALPEPAVGITAGNGFTCARLASGAVSCWGRGDRGALGRGSAAHIGDDEWAGDVEPLQLFPLR